MRLRLPSDPEQRALESLLLRVVCPTMGLIFDVVLLATDSRNPAAYAMASGLILGRLVAKVREDPPSDSSPAIPPSTGAPPTSDSSGPTDSSSSSESS